MAKPGNLESAEASRRRTALVAWCAVAAALNGCRAVDNAQVDVIERELRQQEDYIYELEDYLMEYSEKLRECRACQTPLASGTPAPAASRRQSSATLPGEPTIADDTRRSAAPRRPNGTRAVPPIEAADQGADAFDAPLPAERPTAPALEMEPAPGSPATPVTPPASTPAAPAVDPAELEPPGLEIGQATPPRWDGAAPIAATPPGDEAPPYIPDPADYQLDAETDGAAEVASSEADGLPRDELPTVSAPQLFAAENGAPPEAYSLDPPPLDTAPELPPPADPARLSASRLQIRRVFGNDPGDAADGAAPASLLIVVEALNATDEPVDANGEVSLMVMAGETQETLQRVDRWDFTAEESAAAWQSSRLGDGLHLELPLDGASLPPGRLELWARLVGADGKKLLTRVPFAANELTPLSDAAAADQGDELVNTTAAATGATQPLGANDAEVESAGLLNSMEPPTSGAATRESIADEESLPGQAAEAGAADSAVAAASQWRPATAGNAPVRSQGSATTVGAPAGSWTSQPPGGRFPPPTPRVAARSDGPPRWQQGSGEAPPSNGDGAWAPFR